MSPRKRRTRVLHLDQNQEEYGNQATLKQSRRSSLQVNLSFVSNLDDSGNASQTSDPLQVTGSSSRMLLDMNNKEAALQKSCSDLKTAILSKTREIFDKHNEFSIKTIQILVDRQTQPNPPVPRTPTRSPRVQLAIENDQQIIMSDHGSQHPVQIRSMSGSGSRLSSRKYRNRSPGNEVDIDTLDDDSSIFVTPKKGKSSKEKSSCDSKPTGTSKKRLFSNRKDNGEKNLDREKENSIKIGSRGLKSKIIGNNSPILGGSNKRVLRTTRRKLPVSGSELRSEEESGTDLDSSLNTLESGSVHLGFPVTCSTFIQDDSDSQEENRERVGEGILIIREEAPETPETPSNFSSMEITRVCGKTVAVQARSGADTENNTGEKGADRVSMDLTEAQGGILLERKEVEKNSIAEGGGRIQLEEDSSSNTVRTSLNVNTSIDEVFENDRGSVGRLSKGVEEIPDKGIPEESRKKQTEDSESFDSLENMSLMQRLKNNSGQKPVNENSPCENLLEVLENSGGDRRKEEPSIVEATPFPTSRSMLVKSHLKGLTLDLEPIRSESSSNGESPKSGSFRRLDVRRRRTLLDTIILEDSSEECDSGERRPVEEPEVIGESSDEEDKAGKDKNAKPVQKRKLLPLRQNSDLFTFSPVENVEKKPSDDRKKYLKKKRRKKRRNVAQEVEKEVENGKRADDDKEEEEQEEKQNEELPEGDEEVAEENLGLSEDGESKKNRRRKVVSKNILVKRNAEWDVFERLRKKYNQTESEVPQRNSLNDFQTQSRIPLRAKCCKRSKIVIVTTGLCKGDKGLVKSVIKSLGGAKLESNVSRSTTHVVTTGVRTINLLHGIIRGCWLVSMEWVLKSLEESRWLNPEDFEMKHFSEAVLENRRDRQLFGKSYVPELFATCGFIYIENGTSPPTAVLKNLVKTAGGLITENPQNAKIVIGLKGLREIWVLDSITTGEIQPLQQYRRN